MQTREENNNNVESTVDPPAENDTATTLPPNTGLRGRARRQTPPSLSSDPDPPPPYVSRYGRVRKITTRIQEAMRQQALSSTLALYEDHTIESEFMHPIAYLATNNAATMYFEQAMNQPDASDFVDAVVKEINDHTSHKHWRLIPRWMVSKGTKIIPSVWSLKRKRDILTQLVYKWKACLNIHGGKQELGVNSWETFSPVVMWHSIRLTLVLVIINNWFSRQVDFVLAFPQANIECDIYMELPIKEWKWHMGRETHTCYNYSKTSMVKNKQGVFGFNTYEKS